jgi:type I restriction enzyme M protein
VAPPERDLGKATMEKSLWQAADQFRANSGLKAQEYSGPILGLIFLRFADARFRPRWNELKAAGGSERRGSREDDANVYQSEGLLYLPPDARYFVKAHRGNSAGDLAICGVEKTDETGRLCRMNLAVHGLEGRISHGGDMNSYYIDPHKSVGAFDFVMANPPFNVNAVDMKKLSAASGPGRRFPFGTPSVDNANYLWIQLFYSSLSEKGRSGFVMANSASDARRSEQAIRQQLIEAKAVDVMVAVGPNMFYTVTLPCTLWFFDRGKIGTERENTVLFLDARHLYRQIDRAHRDWSEAQIGFLANIVRLYRGEALDVTLGGEEAQRWIEAYFGADPDAASGEAPTYRDIAGLCKAATLEAIEAQGWSLNPGRYVGVAVGEDLSDEDFKEQLEKLQEELEGLNAQARELEATIAANVAGILGGV